MIDVKNKKCNSVWCDTRINNNKYEGYCLYCYIHLYPNKSISRNYKTKEYAVVTFIKNKFNTLNWINDKRIHNGTSYRRPDLLLDLEYQVIIIEIDENQHLEYTTICDNKRTMEISRDVNHRPIIFIRFNPDSYINKYGVKVSSCWGINKMGISCIKKNKILEWDNRLQELKKQINYYINPLNKIEKTIENIHLFYN